MQLMQLRGFKPWDLAADLSWSLMTSRASWITSIEKLVAVTWRQVLCDVCFWKMLGQGCFILPSYEFLHFVYLCINWIFSWAEVSLFNWSSAARRVASPTILFFWVRHASTPYFRRRMTCRLGSAVASTWTSPTIACIPWALMRPCSAWISEGASWTFWYPGAWQIVGLTPQQQVISELRSVIWHGMA